MDTLLLVVYTKIIQFFVQSRDGGGFGNNDGFVAVVFQDDGEEVRVAVDEVFTRGSLLGDL